MLSRWLPFEKPIVEIEDKIRELQSVRGNKAAKVAERLSALQAERDELIVKIFSDMTPWEKVQMARHPLRPYTLDYINAMCTSFFELHGDRRFGDDPAIVAGLARMEGRSIVIVGHQKGRDTKERQFRNFGSAMPEGYRKAVRVMKVAEKLNKPILCLIDTPAAACLAEAEERGISEAIATSQMEMFRLRVPVIVVVIGEGGSGGAIGIGVGNRVFMLEHAIYSVIPPEGCAAILWHDAGRAAEAAAALKLTAQDALNFGIADAIIEEPLGGAHRNPEQMATRLKETVLTTLSELEKMSPDDLEESRYQRFRRIGVFAEITEQAIANGCAEDANALPATEPNVTED